MRNLKTTLLLLSALAGILPAARASETYSNLSPTGTYHTSGGASIRGSANPAGEILTAVPFTPSASGRLDMVEVGVVHMNGKNAFQMYLYDDLGGLPGAPIEDLGVHAALTSTGGGTQLLQVGSAARPALVLGATYWVVCAAAGTTELSWVTNNQGINGRAQKFGGSWSYAGWALKGSLRVMATPEVTVYCTAGSSASGCQASLSATGTASASASSGFVVTASNVEGAKDGLLFYGTNGRQANSWGSSSSFQCVVPPVMRAGLLSSSGTAGVCDGSFGQDLNALWFANPAKQPGSGAVVQLQLWYRDPQNTSNQTTSLSDALEFSVSP